MQSKDPTILRGKTIDQILTVASPLVLPEDFPIWQGTSTLTIKKAILRHYYMREIGAETVALWRYFLSTKLMEIMPWYVDLHDRMTAMADIYINHTESVSDDMDYGHKISKSGTDTRTVNSTNKDSGSRDVDTTDTGTVNNSTTDTGTRGVQSTEGGTIENSGTNDTNYQSLYSDTPQNGLTSVKQGQYLTNATVDDTTNSVDNTETRNLTKADTETRNLTGSNNQTRNLSGTNKEIRDLMQTLNSTDTMQYGMMDSHSGTDARTIVRSGFSGDKVDVLIRYKEAHINLIKEIIDACGTCWLGVIG